MDEDIDHDVKYEGAMKVVGVVFIGAGFYAMLIFFLGAEMTLPDGPLWACMMLYALSYGAGLLCEFNGYFKCPALLGQLLMGLILRNLPYDEVFLNLPSSWSKNIKAFGLGCIFLRAGLEMDLGEIMKQGIVAARLTVMPGVTEAFAVCVMAMTVWNMPFMLGASMGFILAAVSPAVVVGGMFNLQSKGYGVMKGIPTLVVAAASFDDIVALTGFSVFIGNAVPNDHGIIMTAMHAPIELIGAAILGHIFGHLLGCSRLFDKHYKRLAATLFFGLFCMFGANHYHYSSMGALGCLAIGFVAAKRWCDAGMGKQLSLPPNTHWQHEVEHDIAAIWRHLAQPLLFATIGSSIDFSRIDNSSIPFAILVIIVGLLIRVSIAISITWGNNLSWIERIFIGLAWIPKATVQAALCTIPLTLIEENIDSTNPNFEDYKKWGDQILVTAVFAILLTAPLGVVAIDILGPIMLHKTDFVEDEENPAHDKKWVRNEAKKRVYEEEIKELNKTLSTSFFVQMTDAIESIQQEVKGTKHQESLRMIMEGTVSLHEVIDEEGAYFPVQRLFDCAPSFEEPGHKAIDVVTGELLIDEDHKDFDKKASEVIAVRKKNSRASIDVSYLKNQQPYTTTDVPSPGKMNTDVMRPRKNTPTYIENDDGAISFQRDA